MNVIRTASLLLMAALSVASAAASAADYRIVQRIKIPDGGFDYLSFDAAAGRVYVARTNFTTVIDVKTGKVSQLASASGGHMLLAIPNSTLGLLPERQGTIRIVDTATDAVVADLPAGKDPDAATFDPVSKLAFVVNKESGEATVVDPFARKVVATIPIGGTLQTPVSDGAGHVFVNVDSVPEIAVLDVKSLTLTGRYKLDGCMGASGLAYAAQEKLLISGCLNGIAKVLQAGNGKEVASVAICRGPDATMYDPVRKMAFFPCGGGIGGPHPGDGVLDIMSLADKAHIAVVQHVPTQIGSRTGAVDPKTGRAYVIASKPDTSGVPGPGGRAGRIPGSYEVLVVAP